VRKTINVNSTPIRAFQMVLEQRGLGWKKVMILVRRAPPGETERQAEKREGESRETERDDRRESRPH